MHLGPDKLTISNVENMELREITGTTINNLNSDSNIGLCQTLNKNKI
jgi:hypothetical protein